jgi:hypothetical protein
MSDNMAASAKWRELRRPWAIEALAILFTVIGLATPFLLHYIAGGPETRQTSETSIGIMLWPALILGFYIVHQLIVHSAPDHLSTPLSYLFTPTVSALLCYGSLYFKAREAGLDIPLLDGSPVKLAVLVATVILATIMLSRIHMLEQWARFRAMTWEVSSPSRSDASYWTIALQLYPIIYRPTRFLACPEGLVVQGWHYILAVPFSDVHSITASVTGDVSLAGHYYVTAANELIRLNLSDENMPVFISPAQREEFYTYCAKHISARRASRGTGHGTKAGDTHHGRSFYEHNHANQTKGGAAPPAASP